MSTIKNEIDNYLGMIKISRSLNTARAYTTALATFYNVLAKIKFDPTTTPISTLNEESIAWLFVSVNKLSPATEQLYLAAATGFFEYLSANNLASINLPRMRLLIKQRSRRPGKRLPQFPRSDIDQILQYVNNFTNYLSDNSREHLRALRDRAFLITLADTGLRVHEACNLRRGDIDWNEGHAIIIGKGDKEAVVRFSSRSLKSLKDYLAVRSCLDGVSGKALASLPLFARHDKGSGKHIKPITTTTGRNIVTYRVQQALGDDARENITPHSFRHYFVTTVLRGSGNLKLAQELARHTSIQVTQRYAHLSDDELDRGYHDIFEKPK